MAYIELASEDEASEVAEIFQADRERVGHLANSARVFASRPNAYAAWRQLLGAITEQMGLPLRARDRGSRARASLELLHARAWKRSSRARL